MRENPTIRAYWTGQSFVPDGNFAMAQACDRLGEGEVVNLDIDPDRSGKSHKHQFAFVRTAWSNLPESMTGEAWALNADVLRKYALIKTGHCDVEMMAMGSEARAIRAADMMGRIAKRLDGFALTSVDGTVANCFTPHSQKLKLMGGERFKRSKQDILAFLADLIGVTPEQLAKMGKEGTA